MTPTGLLYSTGFESGLAQDWDLDWKEGAGWQVVEQDGNIVLNGHGHRWTTFNLGTNWTDYAFKFRLMLHHGTVHVNYRRGEDSRYFFGFSLQGLYLQKQAGKDFTIVYRDKDKVAWGKRIHIQKYITDKVYELTGGSPTGIDYLSDRKVGRTIKLTFVTAPRQRLKSFDFDLNTLSPTGLSARGKRLHAKPVRRIWLARGAG